MFSKLEFYALLALTLICAIASAGAAWYVRGLMDAKEIAKLNLEQSQSISDARNAAIEKMNAALIAAKNYEQEKDALKPIVLKVKQDAQPIIQYLDSCPLRDDAVSLLQSAADAADAGRSGKSSPSVRRDATGRTTDAPGP